ncbi:MAG: hypothetical protein KKD73_11655, partial [Proteobacteria bacterium]|nr:hypothetical protein [Pseudomonadota bacterium]MBU1641314.1 hypothetical protein [Pseudomonadota bacterium]
KGILGKDRHYLPERDIVLDYRGLTTKPVPKDVSNYAKLLSVLQQTTHLRVFLHKAIVARRP